MPMGKGTYGSKVGRPKKSLLTAKQKTLPDFEKEDYKEEEEWLRKKTVSSVSTKKMYNIYWRTTVWFISRC